MKSKQTINYAIQIICAVVLLQTLYFKFTAAPESVAIFTQLGMEPAGRIIIGILELIAAILLLIPASGAYGAVLTFGILTGAVIGHVTKLGFSGDMFTLGMLALFIWLASLVIIYRRRAEIPIVRHMLDRSNQ